MRKPASTKAERMRRCPARGVATSVRTTGIVMVLAGTLALGGCGTSGGSSGTGGNGNGQGGSTSTGLGGNTGGGGTTGAGASSGGATGGGGTTSTGGGGNTTTGPGGMTGTAGASGGLGGASGVAGSTGATQVRAISSFDDSWLFFLGDPSGAQQTVFADGAWRPVHVPHDWSIEGQFDQAASTLGNGGYLPAGVGWYRKHFTLPASMSGQRIFVEFDGVMANSDVYINGMLLGNRPFGYVSFRYEITAQATFGTTANVIAVRADNSAQPASRWYAGAGIYRHVRLIVTNPVHIAQWATVVTTPTASATAAMVHVQTTVTNQGTSAQSVTVQAVVTDPAGVRLAPVVSAAQSVGAGASVNYAVDVPVSNPRLWSPSSPSMYQLAASVVVGGNPIDDDVVPFGIRTIRFDPTTGFSLNGVSLKMKGAAMHHDVSGLGSAVPLRAWQRRLAQMKSLGANALRTSHNPFAPEVLDLCDRMGIMVMDEFFDAWTQHKLGGDYGGAPFNMWGTIDLTDTIKRDRNHPSLVIYSIGNEIRDSVASMMTTATRLVAAAHAADPTRPTTQALFQPVPGGAFPATGTGGMLNTVDVYGANYRGSEVLTATAYTPLHAGVVTEDDSSTSTNWTLVTANAPMVGDFIWTAFDYLGEAAGLYPVIGSSMGVMDRMGTPKTAGARTATRWQTAWGAPPAATPPTAGAATRVALTADHASIVTDLNDISYVKAAISDATGRIVTTADSLVTFAITGPGTIVAVDSGSVMAESFRGNSRNAFQGLAFALVQATGPGAITVTASSAGLAGGTVTVQSTAGSFVPCAGTCD
jgi:beta-galactosidase